MENELQAVVALARQVGAYIKYEATQFEKSAIEHKGLNDLVSYVDKTAEERLVKGLAAIWPTAGFITEEGTAITRQAEYNWIVDPLDGTTNFIHGLPVFAVSIALAQHGQVVMGVVYEINRDESFYARKGGNAYCNGQVIHVSGTERLADGLVATGFPYYNFGQMPQYLAILDQLMQKSHGLRRMGSAAVDLAYVACGRFEGFFEYNLNPWDVAAGAFIVQQAGGTVTDFKGGADFVFGKEIIAACQVHGELHGVIQDKWQA